MDGAVTGATATVQASQVLPGDEITEVDSPDGPWYRVLRVDAEGGRLLIDDGDAVGVEVDVQDWTSTVLRRRPTAG